MVSGEHHESPQVKRREIQKSSRVKWLGRDQTVSSSVMNNSPVCPPTPHFLHFELFQSEDDEWGHMFSPITPYSSPVSCIVLQECCSGPSLATLIRLTCPDAVSSNVLHVCCLSCCRVTLFHLFPFLFPPVMFTAFKYCFLCLFWAV